jgi:hypothetical protein
MAPPVLLEVSARYSWVAWLFCEQSPASVEQPSGKLAGGIQRAGSSFLEGQAEALDRAGT